jgi:hypothetical protein
MDWWIWVLIVVAVLVILAIVVMSASSKRRRAHLQQRFGPEYDRTVEHSDRRRDAERDLREREREHDGLDLRPLSSASRDRYQHDWEALQSKFVDRPQVAVTEADALVSSVMRERGYPVDDWEQQSALVSVDHPRVVEHYRTAHAISERSVHGSASTEDLRVAVVSYRALFEELVEDHDEDGVDAPRDGHGTGAGAN